MQSPPSAGRRVPGVPACLAAAWLAVWAAVSPAGAQTAAPSHTVPSSQTREAPQSPGFGDGFTVQSADGRNRLSLGALMHFDGRFVLTTPSPITNTFSMRRVRAGFSAVFAGVFEFRFNPEFGNGQTFIQDMYLDTRFSAAARLRVGKYKVPYGYEMLIVAPRILLPERALAASNLAPNRDVGVELFGELGDGRFSYAGGVFNGGPDGGSALDGDSNGAKDLLGYLEYRPFRSEGAGTHPLDGLILRAAATTGIEEGPLLPLRTSVLQPVFTYASGVIADGRRQRVSPSVAYWHGSAGIWAEHYRTTQRLTHAATHLESINTGWAITGTYMLTGEPATLGVIRPRRPLDPEAGHWGALQLVARYSALTVDADAFAAGLVGAGSSRHAAQAAIGLNWHLTPVVKHVVMFEHTRFDGPAPRRSEPALIVRTQVAF